MPRRRWLFAALAAVAVLLIAGRAAAALFVDYAWYEALGAAPLWRLKTAYEFVLRGSALGLGALFVFLNLLGVRSSIASLVLTRRVANLEFGEEVSGRWLIGISAALALLVGGILSAVLDDWTLLAMMNPDPATGFAGSAARDIPSNYFVFQYPLESAIYVWAMLLLVATGVLVILLYALTPSLRVERGTLRITTHVRRHLTVLGTVLLVLLAWSYRLDAFDLFLSGSGRDGMFAAVDQELVWPATQFLAFAGLAAALVVLRAGWVGQMRVAFFTVTAMLVLAIGLRHVIPAAYMALRDPSRREREEADMERLRVGFTRSAYGVEKTPDAVRLADSLTPFPSIADLPRSMSSWDGPMLDSAVAHLGGVGPAVGEIAWAGSADGLRATIVQRPGAAAAGQSTEWTRTELTAPLLDERGALRRDALGEPTRMDPPLILPELRDSVADYLLVSDPMNRVLAPRMSSWIARAAHAWTERDMHLLTNVIPSDARIVRGRDARERVAALAPFFALGRETRTVALGDSLYWVIELYSATASYPHSLHLNAAGEERSYFRHAATALVDAHSGSVRFAYDPASLDPIARTWIARFPWLFVQNKNLSPALLAALPPATDGALAKAEAMARYGSSTIGSTPRFAARPDGADSTLAGEGPAVFALPSPAHPTAWALPLLDASDRVTGLVVALGGPRHPVLWVPSQVTGPRWREQVLEPLRRTLDAPGGVPRDARRLHGRVHSVPVRGEFVFLQSLYAWRAGEPLSVARLSAFAHDSISTGNSLQEAIARGTVGWHGRTAPPSTTAELRARVAALYESMRTALRRGDLARFGAAFDSLGALIGRSAP